MGTQTGMIALDTNILVRYLTDDDKTLSARAQEIIEQNHCFVTRVVLLETYQVLESFYELGKDEILIALRTIFGLDNLVVEDYLATARSVAWYEAGMDFADALTLASAFGQDHLATFDRDFSRI
ncbi:MAG: type II toxin-antitoxin system VapC family toxin, partial [Burkholderiales bacterium]